MNLKTNPFFIKLERAVKKIGRDIKSLVSRVTVVEQGQESGVVGYATKTAMEADTGQPTGTIGYVTNDATILNNGYYRWTGAEWVATVEAVRSRTWAEGTDAEVEALGGEKSSKGWAGVATDEADRSELNAVINVNIMNTDPYLSYLYEAVATGHEIQNYGDTQQTIYNNE